MRNIIIRRADKMYGGYDYIEFNQETQQFTKGNSRAHMGHGRDYFMINVATKKELKEKEHSLLILGYEQIETFGKLL